MIECEFYCAKRDGGKADLRIRIKSTGDIFNVCKRCLGWMNTKTFEVLEEYA